MTQDVGRPSGQPCHSGFAPSQSTLSRPFGECQAQGVTGRMLGLIAYVTGLPDDLRWTPEFTHYVNEEFNALHVALTKAGGGHE